MYIQNRLVGHLTVIYGPMFSEKSGELIHRLSITKTYQGKKCICFKPVIDNRFSETEIVSRIGTRLDAISVKDSFSEKELDMCDEYDMIGIDEAEFFDDSILWFVDNLMKMKKTIIVAGLQLDYLGEPFGKMPELMAQADELIQKMACCSKCGQPAGFTQRVVDGKEVLNGDKILVGDTEAYEPRCRQHFKKKD